MKQIQGTSYNIEGDIVGRVTFGNGNLFGRSNNILVCNDVNKPTFGYLAIITECTTFTSKRKPYCIVDNISDFHEGDVIVTQVQLINATLGGRGKRENKTRTREGNFTSCSSLKNDYLCP